MATTKEQRAKKEAEWLADHLQMLNGLKKRTPAQDLLIDVCAIPEDERDESDNEMLQALIATAKAEEATKKNWGLVMQIKSEKSEKERKSRTHELIQWGLALVAAGWVDSKTGKPRSPHLTRNALAGVITGAVELPTNHPKWSGWDERGASILGEYDKLSNAKEEAPVPPATIPPSASILADRKEALESMTINDRG